jgi:hypothetical protein
VANLNAGEVRQVGPLLWNPPPPAPSDHYCLYVRVVSAQDQITYAETANVGENARQSNNIVWRNVNVVNLLSSTSVTFVVRNVDEKRDTVDLVVRVPEEFLKIGEVHVSLRAEVDERWLAERKPIRGLVAVRRRPTLATSEAKVAGRIRYPEASEEEPPEVPATRYQVERPELRLKELELPPGALMPVTLTFGSERKIRKPFEIDVVQMEGRKEVGGIRYLVQNGN